MNLKDNWCTRDSRIAQSPRMFEGEVVVSLLPDRTSAVVWKGQVTVKDTTRLYRFVAMPTGMTCVERCDVAEYWNGVSRDFVSDWQCLFSRLPEVTRETTRGFMTMLSVRKTDLTHTGYVSVTATDQIITHNWILRTQTAQSPQNLPILQNPASHYHIY
jgi:hypothetical protein